MLEPNNNWKRPLLLGAGLVVVSQLAYSAYVCWQFDNWGERSAFGESFGALNTLFAGLALAGVVHTIFLQVKEAADARRDQAESLRLVEAQIAVLRDDVALQRSRDRLERGPFFRLTSNSTSAGRLDLGIENVGAPVIIQDFVGVEGASVSSWHPTTWATGEKFSAACPLADSAKQCSFDMMVVDRAGETRSFRL